jgi:hypothetical protein
MLAYGIGAILTVSGQPGTALEELPVISQPVRFKEDYSASLSGEQTTAYGTTTGMILQAYGGPGNPSEASPQDLQF